LLIVDCVKEYYIFFIINYIPTYNKNIIKIKIFNIQISSNYSSIYNN